jgi:heme exporter protein B
VAALLAALLSVTQLYERDHADGSLEQMVLAAGPGFPFGVALAKALAHWLLTGLPLAIVSPLFGTMLGLPLPAVGLLNATLWLGTPLLSLLGGLGAALTVGLRGGPALLVLLVVPLAVPALVFGAGAVAAFEAGLPATGHLALLAAFLIVTALVALPAAAAALRIATE